LKAAIDRETVDYIRLNTSTNIAIALEYMHP